jgi:ATP-dependent exoDNAse (exonuclease V) beta subunit
MNLKIISAGAGSGKTYRLTTELVSLLASGEMKASGIIATTFTKKAASELQERVRVRLLEEGLSEAANDLANALIGTVHGLGVKLLKRFAFEAGVSPDVDIIADDDQQVMFNQSLAMVLTLDKVAEMERLASRLGLQKSERYSTDWRRMLKDLTEVARTNDFGAADLENSKLKSFESFRAFLDEPAQRPHELWNQDLEAHIEEAILGLENSGDTTKVTADGTKTLKELLGELKLRNELFWFNWVKIAKLKVGAKSRDHIAPLVDFANSHLSHQGFHDDVKAFIFNVFELATEAIEEYGNYKKSRGLIDYTDMEVLVKRLLDDPFVQEVLKEELDLLMVDEFQDTSPLQLEIFLKLSRFAKIAIWVGDPKQSIYGFRGAEPALMEAVISSAGGLKKDNILAHSWRSREDIVLATNAVFTKAFSKMPPEQVALQPKRRKKAVNSSANKEDEPAGMGEALVHWHFKYDGDGRAPGKEWMNHCIATTLETALSRGILILPKGEKNYRTAKPGDVAILCRSNNDCKDMAEALHHAGLRAAISRTGLLATAEAKLILACLKFILNKYDSLSVAEILLLAGNMSTEEIIEDRLAFLKNQQAEKPAQKWGEQNPFIGSLNLLREKVAELSGTEILTLLLEELDLKRIIVAWGNTQQRLANVDMLSSLASKYEEACNRLHSAASLGGLLLWLNDLEGNGLDTQGSGENPDAVNVLTYHKSKGLEYPIVLCHNLENNLREDVWGLNIVSEQEKVDLANLLGNRWLRFWVNPYADLVKSTVLDDRLSNSDAKAKKRLEALEEEARLLYVGLTRARDYLVFPTRQKPTLWLNRVCNNGQEENPALNPDAGESNWEWEGRLLGMDTQAFYYPNDFGSRELPTESILFWGERAGRADFPLFHLEPTKNGKTAHLPWKETALTSPLALPDLPEKKSVAKALHSFLLADNPVYPIVERLEMAEGLIRRFETGQWIDKEVFIAKSDEFHQWVGSYFKPNKTTVKYPAHLSEGGSAFKCTIDLLVENEEGLSAVFLSDFIGSQKHLLKKAQEQEATVLHAAKVLCQLYGTAQIHAWVYFLVNGVGFHCQVHQNKKGLAR